MKIKNLISTLLLLAVAVGFAISLESCNDPCDDAKRVNADFLTYNELYYFDKENGKVVEKTKIVEEDTFMLGYVYFEANDPHAESYEWTIGSDPRKRTEKKFSLIFKDPLVVQENPLPIKLKIKKTPDSKCFPDDPGVDSVTHFIYFLSTWPVLGKYLGSDNTDPNNKYTIEIFRGVVQGFINASLIKNLPNNCTELVATFKSGTAFEFAIDRFELDQTLEFPDCIFRELDKKVGYLKPDRKTIVIDYEFTGKYEQEGSLQKRIFTGVRQ